MFEYKDEIIEMALSDKVPFETIKGLYDLDESWVNFSLKLRLGLVHIEPGANVWNASLNSVTFSSRLT